MTYAKPAGYKTYGAIGIGGFAGRCYKLWNGFITSSKYSPSPYSAQVADLTFSAAPANLSQILIQDGPTLKTFTYTWAGSPGSGIIPLVAGGGTAAQAATASDVALSAQLTYWSADVLVPGVLRLTSLLPGVNTAPTFVGVTNIDMVRVLAGLGAKVPGRVGQIFCFLPAE